MICKTCGTENSETMSFCKNCGQPLMGDERAAVQTMGNVNNGGMFSGNTVNAANGAAFGSQANGFNTGYNTGYTGAVDIGLKMSKKEMFELPTFNQANKTINGWTIFMIVMGVINLLIELVMGVYPIDGLLLLVLGIVLRMTKSLGAAIAVLILGIFSVVYGIFTTGKPVGLLYVIGGCILCSVTTKLKNAYDTYLQTGVITYQ
ncbi:zinc ribbon domain-containing protein [Butyrivibrio sp. X503]|uniref:zinc-ribbon domain-containing protein n=1 Tax=Butyrivibrio sp. X503 TaxID=2364878 RepID=UPI000EA8E4E7|nr:zinc ribbon domain-containing protein [Butyrivibrio sp. X503]RKM55636.1 zinc ribbon domain-containing protein [Butyrivibrio sp. X503]